MFEGTKFPCLAECPEVRDLNSMTVNNYLSGQETALFEKAVDAYLDMAQNIADIAFRITSYNVCYTKLLRVVICNGIGHIL